MKDMLAAFAVRFGEYPSVLSEKYGHAQFQFSGGMEHQTVTSLGSANESSWSRTSSCTSGGAT